MDNALSLANHFLIAMPSMQDPNFARTVTLICEHNEHGAMGIVINRPTDLILRDIVVHDPLGEWESPLVVNEKLGVSTSRDIIVALAEDRGPKRFLLALGYAGWSPGQIEHELKENAWLSTPADMEIVFGLPAEQRWEAAARLVGVDLATISSDAGHA